MAALSLPLRAVRPLQCSKSFESAACSLRGPAARVRAFLQAGCRSNGVKAPTTTFRCLCRPLYRIVWPAKRAMIWLLCLFTCVSVTRVAANCNVEQAIEGMKDCKHGLHTIEKKSFNASNPEHVKEACCSATGRLEACLHTAVTSAGCLHEVDYVVKMLMKHLRTLLGDIYKANCWYGCGTGTRHGPQPVAVVTTLSLATLLLTLFRTR